MTNPEIVKELVLALIISVVVAVFIGFIQDAPQNIGIYVSAGMIGQIWVKYRKWQRENG